MNKNIHSDNGVDPDREMEAFQGYHQGQLDLFIPLQNNKKKNINLQKLLLENLKKIDYFQKFL